MAETLISLAATLGTYWLYTAIALKWRGFRLGPVTRIKSVRTKSRIDAWLSQAGLANVDKKQFAMVTGAIAVMAGLLAYAMFGGLLVSAVVAGFAASLPPGIFQSRRSTRRQRAQEAWPYMIEEMRIQTSSLGRSIPQALFEVGARCPKELRSAFDAAEREWRLTTDLERTLRVLKDELADPTADAACETLLVAHEVGGGDLDRRLGALAEDRRIDVQGRKDARSRLAGARFARLFVLFVPGGMALAGMSIGNGRAAYQTSIGQSVVLLAICLMIVCWVWAGRVMRIPQPKRVLDL